MNTTKKERLETVNQIIKEISSRGRKFFRHKDRIAYFQLTESGRIVLWDEYTGVTVNVYDKIKGFCPPNRNFTSGGTLWALVLDFRDFILKGGYTNHTHGYGGLYCRHWGYPEDDMLAIQKKAISLGYLTEPPQPCP